MNRKITIILTLVSLFLGCSKKAETKQEYYTNGVLKTVIEYNDVGDVIKYTHYDLIGELAFILHYKDKIPLKNVTGVPWINLIWNEHNYCINDTIYLEIELAKPPYIDVEFKMRNNKGEAKVLDKGNSYIYNYVMSDSVENLTLIAVFSGPESKYLTFKRAIPISCDSIH